MKEQVIKLIDSLRKKMLERGMDFYLISNNDPHSSEYTAECFHYRTLFSGFTGSNGSMLIGQNNAYLWTDGRYFIQAEKEMTGTGIQLMRMGENGVPTMIQFLINQNRNITLGMYGLMVSGNFVEQLKKEWEKKSGDAEYKLSVLMEENLAYECIKEHIPEHKSIPDATKWFVLSDEIKGTDASDKIKRIREKLKEKKLDMFVSNELDSNMWILNVRGRDIPCNPVGFSYVCISEDRVICFTYPEAMTEAVMDYFKQKKIEWKDYNTFSEEILNLVKAKRVAAVISSLDALTYQNIKTNSDKIEDYDCEVGIQKACKTEAEIENIKKVYEKDSAAVCKFLCWLSKQKVETLSEYDAGMKMDEIRKATEGCFDLSFDTIAAYGSNAAMMHYEATKEQFAMLKREGMFLLDSGGQYFGGTTDVTRTVALGNVTEEEKSDFTKVLRGMLALQNAVFMKGCTGVSLDILARRPVWECLQDYKCGTGHGIGYMLSVHEGPQGIRPRSAYPKKDQEIIPGMLVSDEPGVYKEGKYGIRTENILLCVEKGNSADGTFYSFEPLTYVPIDRRLVNYNEMNSEEIKWYENYQSRVWEVISPYLSEEEQLWLADETIISKKTLQ